MPSTLNPTDLYEQLKPFGAVDVTVSWPYWGIRIRTPDLEPEYITVNLMLQSSSPLAVTQNWSNARLRRDLYEQFEAAWAKLIDLGYVLDLWHPHFEIDGTINYRIDTGEKQHLAVRASAEFRLKIPGATARNLDAYKNYRKV